jgi:hypothetical protein
MFLHWRLLFGRSPTGTPLVGVGLLIVRVGICRHGIAPTGSTFARSFFCVNAVAGGGAAAGSLVLFLQVLLSRLLPALPVQNFLPEPRIIAVELSQGSRCWRRSHKPSFHGHMLAANGSNQFRCRFSVLPHGVTTLLSLFVDVCCCCCCRCCCCYCCAIALYGKRETTIDTT